MTAEGAILRDNVSIQVRLCDKQSGEAETAAKEGVKVRSQEISLFAPSPNAAIRHHDQADPPYSEELEPTEAEKPAGHVTGEESEEKKTAPNCRLDWTG